MSAIAPNSVADPSYGLSDHYLGAKGQEYFAWQGGGGHCAAMIHCRKFEQWIQPRHTVIDFGCGGGFLLARLNCKHRIGIEINPAAKEHAQSLGIECYSDASEISDAVADVIVSDHALEHVPYPIGALTTLRSKLKPGGVLSLCVPIDNWRIQRRYDPADLHHHLHTWTPQLLGNTLYEAGYNVTSIYARIFAWPGKWTVACYGRLPFAVFRGICWSYGVMSGRGREILAVARPR